MKQFLKISLPFAFIGVAVVIAMGMYASRPEAKFNPPPPPLLLVEVAEIGKKHVTHVVRSQGTIAPRTETRLIAEAAGQIVEVSPNFVSGGFFRKGHVLVRIDPRNYASVVKRAKAEVARAATKLETERGLAGFARADWERLRKLNPSKGSGTDLALRKPQMREAVAMLQSAQADLEKAEGDLDRTVIRAPYDGLLRTKTADVGQYVNVGSELAVTFAVDIAEVRLPVTQQDLRYLDIQRMRGNQSLPVTLKARLGAQNIEWTGRIDRSEGVFDVDSRVLYLVAQIEDPYDLQGSDRVPLLMGTYVSAEIEGQVAGDLFLVPRHAMQRGSTLWIVDEEMRIYPREVNVVRRDDDFVYISEGVAVGERYCLTPIDQPLPGMMIRSVNEQS